MDQEPNRPISEAPFWEKLPHQTYSIPGKVFLLGEYAVLAGYGAMVAAVGPRFIIHMTKASQETVQGGTQFHPQSPAGLLTEYANRKGAPRLCFWKQDPHLGSGGFGESTASFGLLYRAYADLGVFGRTDWRSVWQTYRQFVEAETRLARGIPAPSGADLVAQWQGGVVYFEPGKEKVTDLSRSMDYSSLLFFSAAHLPGRKVATHEHLLEIAARGLFNLESSLFRDLSQMVEAYLPDSPNGFQPEALTQYADALWGVGLEQKAAHEDRLALAELDEVAAVKGTGALLSDGMVVMLNERTPSVLDRVIRFAERRGLRLVSDRLVMEPGCLEEYS